MRILAIETSCDDTAVCLAQASGSFGPDFRFEIIGNAARSQAALHARYGGVYPNLAKNEHQKYINPLIEKVLGGSVRGKPDIDCIAVTYGPGLEPSLWVGVSAARELATQWDIPLVGVNHMEGHVLASLLRNTGELSYVLHDVSYPLVSLLVSGGHTELILMKGVGSYEYLGRTRDDAAGEAFDKIARMLGLPYPGGPEISRLAKRDRGKGRIASENIAQRRKYVHEVGGSPNRHHGAHSAFSDAILPLPRPMMNSGDYDFSFSGLKTATHKLTEFHQPLSDDMRSAIAREAEDAIVDVLISKTMRAAQEYGARTILVGGGVSANAYLRNRLHEAAAPLGLPVHFPEEGLPTDNAIMIALAGYFRAFNKEYADPATLRACGKLSLS